MANVTHIVMNIVIIYKVFQAGFDYDIDQMVALIHD